MIDLSLIYVGGLTEIRLLMIDTCLNQNKDVARAPVNHHNF